MDHVLPFHWLINVWLTPMSEGGGGDDPTEMQNVVDGQETALSALGCDRPVFGLVTMDHVLPFPLLDEGLWR